MLQTRFGRLHRAAQHLASRGDAHGAILVLYALGFVSFMLFGALAIDVGYWYCQKAKFQMTMDAAAVSALGTISVGTKLSTQESYIVSTLNTIASANGYSSTQFTSTAPTYLTTGNGNTARVYQVTVQAHQTLTTWFWNIFNVNTISVHGYVTAEDDSNPFIGCAFIANKGITYQGQSSANNMVFDSYDSTVGAYSASNSAPAGYGTSKYDGTNFILCGNSTNQFKGDTFVAGQVGVYGNISYSGNKGKDLNYVLRDVFYSGSQSGKVNNDYLIKGADTKSAGLSSFTTTCTTFPANISTSNDNAAGGVMACSGTINVTDCNTIKAGNNPTGTGTTYQPTSNSTVTISVLSGGTDIYCNNWNFGNKVTINIKSGSGIVSSANPVNLWVDTQMKLAGSLQFDPSTSPSAPCLSIMGNDANSPPLQFGVSNGATSLNLYADICSIKSTMTVVAGSNLHFFGGFFLSTVVSANTEKYTYDEAIGPVGLGNDPVVRAVHVVE